MKREEEYDYLNVIYFKVKEKFFFVQTNIDNSKLCYCLQLGMNNIDKFLFWDDTFSHCVDMFYYDFSAS